MPLSIRQWDGYERKPSREFPNQWHVEASTQEKRSELRMITMLVPRRATDTEGAWQAERLESESAVGVRVLRDGKATVVAFRKAGQGDSVPAGIHMDGAVKVADSAQ